MINAYGSYYTNKNFYAEYGRDSEGVPSMCLIGAIDAEGNTSAEARDAYYPGSVDTTVSMVYFHGTLTIFYEKQMYVGGVDGVEVPIECEGPEAQALLEMFGWEPEEDEWVPCGEECDTVD